MGLVIRICCYPYWERTYFVQELDPNIAKERAYKMFKRVATCHCPDTLEEAEHDENNWTIDVIARVEQIII